MASYAERLVVTTTKTDLFSGLSDTGTYEITVTNGNCYITHDNSAASTDSVSLNGISTSNLNVLKFTWDSSSPLYAFVGSGSGSLEYILTPVASVGLAVSCN